MFQYKNEQPLEHHCQNGTVFKAERCDLRGGVTAIVRDGITPERLLADGMEFGAWHRHVIWPDLIGYTGPPYIAEIRSPEPEETGADPEILDLPLMDYFSHEILEKYGHVVLASRIYSALEHELKDRFRKCEPEHQINTVGGFLKNITVHKLNRTPQISKKSIEVIVRRLAADNLALKAK